jgi:hypothetical protein
MALSDAAEAKHVDSHEAQSDSFDADSANSKSDTKSAAESDAKSDAESDAKSDSKSDSKSDCTMDSPAPTHKLSPPDVPVVGLKAGVQFFGSDVTIVEEGFTRLLVSRP